jgi:hypothetical protein
MDSHQFIGFLSKVRMRQGTLRSVTFMQLGVHFERRIVVANRRDLLEISRKESSDRSEGLILMDVAKLMRNQSVGYVAAADEDGMAKGESVHVRPEQSGLVGSLTEFRVVWLRHVIDNLDSDEVGVLDADPRSQFQFDIRQRAPCRQDVELLCLNPLDRERQQSRQYLKKTIHRRQPDIPTWLRIGASLHPLNSG